MIAGPDPPPSDEPTFADVFNALTFGGRPARRRSRRAFAQQDPVAPADPSAAVVQLPTADLVDRTVDHVARGRSTVNSADAEEPAEPLTVAAIVRPYAWTRGRTRSTVDLQVETLVSATDPPPPSAPPEHRTISELCLLPHSVAEVAALLDVPLGVAKVLISDMAEAGLLVVHGMAGAGGPHAHLLLMERVLSGLRRL